MPRIVAGWAGSLHLVAPPSGTRPTSDRVREALFSTLEARGGLEGARVLDLYAGSGALGLEAVSRGAVAAVLVDNAPAAARALRQNSATVLRAAPTGAAPRIRVVPRSARAYLEGAASDGPDRPTLVFLDPPYALAGATIARDLELVANRALPGATVVLERSARGPLPQTPPGMLLERARTYGDTVVAILLVTADQPAATS